MGRGRQEEPARPVFKIGGTTIPDKAKDDVAASDEPIRPIKKYGGSSGSSPEAVSPADSRDVGAPWETVDRAQDGEQEDTANDAGVPVQKTVA